MHYLTVIQNVNYEYYKLKKIENKILFFLAIAISRINNGERPNTFFHTDNGTIAVIVIALTKLVGFDIYFNKKIVANSKTIYRFSTNGRKDPDVVNENPLAIINAVFNKYEVPAISKDEVLSYFNGVYALVSYKGIDSHQNCNENDLEPLFSISSFDFDFEKVQEKMNLIQKKDKKISLMINSCKLALASISIIAILAVVYNYA